MSATSDRPDGPGFEPTDPPTFELEFMVDDPEEPTELTIYSPGENVVSTNWITADLDTAVPIQAVR